MTGRQERELCEVTAAFESEMARAEKALIEKRIPYEANLLFMYLWNRGFGTPSYQCAGWVRLLDHKLADFIGYDVARQNYEALTELPVSPRGHLRVLRSQALWAKRC